MWKKKEKTSIYRIFADLSKQWFKLEFFTGPGKVNAAFGVLLVIAMIALTEMDWFIKIILSGVGAIKTWILKENVVEPYESADLSLLIILTVIFFVICFALLCALEYSQKKADKSSYLQKDDAGD